MAGIYLGLQNQIRRHRLVNRKGIAVCMLIIYRPAFFTQAICHSHVSFINYPY